MHRYLFGPISKSFADQNLHRQRQAGECLAFDSAGTTDVTIGPADTWAQVCARLPGGWRPDFIVLYMPYTSIPGCLWSAPIPLVGVALDCHLLWHYYRHRLRSCDLVLSDLSAVDLLAREGITQVRAANLHGYEARFASDNVASEQPALAERANEGDRSGEGIGETGAAKSLPVRDIDILFVGNLNPAVQMERLPWLGRLARLSKRWRVAIHAGIFGDAYRRLLERARIVFNRVPPGRSTRRIFETAAAGALLFEDAANSEAGRYFHGLNRQLKPEANGVPSRTIAPLTKASQGGKEGEADENGRPECVFYHSDNLESLLEYYLEHEDDRQALAAAARRRARRYQFADFWGEIVATIESDWLVLVGRAQQRSLPGRCEELSIRSWQALNAPPRSDPTLIPALESALQAEPRSPFLHNALGLALARVSTNPGTATSAAEAAIAHFRQAMANCPGHLMARLNLAEALEVADHKEAAIDEARAALAALERFPEIDSAYLDSGNFQSDFGLFRMEWERAGWTNAGRPRGEVQAKTQLLRWRLQALLAKLTGELAHYYEAFLARPDLTASAAALGCTLASKGLAAEALAPLRRSLAENPFDRDVARALFHVLGVTGDAEGQRKLVEDRLLLSRAAPQAVPAEPWFSGPRPMGNELASIIILCCNQLEFTRQCLTSVLRCARPPYELIVVDNASADGTPEYLEEIRLGNLRGASNNGQHNPGVAHQPVRVEIIRNETNVGFPAGCNQALTRARGRFLIFLNNDTIVTPGWLDGLITWSLHDWPSVGMVGAVTNNAPDNQGIRCGYTTLDGLDDFAAQRRRQFAGQMLPVKRLTGFCLLVRREVSDRIGPFDERFGTGFFDDDDLCLRAREAGFRLLIAQDVYIHHFGSRTFNSLGIKTRDLLLKNFDLFRAKWGEEHAIGYRLIGPTEGGSQGHTAPGQKEGVNQTSIETSTPLPVAKSPQEHDTGRPEVALPNPIDPGLQGPVPGNVLADFRPLTVSSEIIVRDVLPLRTSLCMIVKNEEPRLGGCLETAVDLFDEIIVVDTGSVDQTKEVASRFGARVFDSPWVDSFAAARNEGVRHAKGRWIMWLDADDRLDQDNRSRLRNLFASLGDELDAYAMKVRSVMDAARSSFRLLDQVRLFPNHPKVRWEYRVHEQTLPAVRALGGVVRWTGVIIDHVGYQDAETRKIKLQRNLRLLELDAKDRTDDPFTLFNLGWTLLDLGKAAEALPRMQRSLERSSPDSSIVRKLYHLITLAHRQLGQRPEALSVCRRGLAQFPDDTELIFEEAMILLETQGLTAAEDNLLRLVETKPSQYFASVDDGMRGYKTRNLLARHYADQGRTAEAEIQWRAALAERPNFVPAWMSLGEMFLNQQRWQELEAVTTRLEKEAAAVEADMLRARAQRARGEFPPARRILEGTIIRFPEALPPRVLLSHVLLQEGVHLEAAENVLRDLITLDPNNSEARHNLRVLLSKQGRAVEV